MSRRTEPKRPETYANYIQTTPRENLTAYERRMLKSDQEWVAANPKLAKELNALIGKEVHLVRDYNAVNNVSVYPKGGKVKVLERWRDRLHTLWNEHTILQVRPDWVSQEPVLEVKVGKAAGKGRLISPPVVTSSTQGEIGAPTRRVWVKSKQPCRECGVAGQHFWWLWGGSEGAGDERHECRACKATWWVDGAGSDLV